MDFLIGSMEKTDAVCNERFGDRCFKFCFSFVQDGEPFRELDRFLWESRHEFAPFRNHYEGPVAVDLTEWSDKYPNRYFTAFLYFLKDQLVTPNRCTDCVLISERDCGEAIVKELEKFFRLDMNVCEDRGQTGKRPSVRKIGFAVEEEERDHV